MKPSSKALIAFIIIAVIGLGAVIGGAFLEKEFIKEIYNCIIDPEYGYNTIEYNEDEGQSVTKVNLSTRHGHIEVKSGEKFNLTAKTRLSTAETNISTDGEFNYSEKSLIGDWGFFKKYNSYVLTLPEGRAVELNIENVSGKIIVNNCLNIANLKLKTSAGDIIIDKVKANEVTLTSSSGNLELKGAETASLNMATSSGDVKIENIKVDDATLTSAGGDFEIKGAEAVSLNMATTAGEVKIENVKVDGALMIDNTSGSIWAKSVISKEASLETMSGKVIAEDISTETTLRMKSVSGRVMLTNPSNSNIDLQSTSGDVIIMLKDNHFNFAAKTTSGKVECDGVDKGKSFSQTNDSLYTLTAKTVSGDIEILTSHN